eukprot:CAMPEP_0116126916 /NCGR_PEP_ID=MMETSP0329-20121206/6575_1 /TAXON_ID=697910 /ORGANISM="Pseudo-nitzschia arenysensis, Strain B593" /LENGTH=322 /DNA_ID=CAMNT_0003621007 /DNA_START=84 /DNA_END=1052 /DNA_ORIENTATION=-
MDHSTPVRPMANNHNGTDEDEIDVESLRLVFGQEDFDQRKAHELRELWMEKTQSSNDTKAKMPRFLLDPKNKDHVAPHTVALQLLLGRKGKSDGDGLYKRVPRSEHENNNNNNNISNRDMELRNSNYNNQTKRKDHHTSESLGMVVHLIAVVLAIIMLACQFTLEVLGGAGAIWGCAEIARLRKGGPIDPSWDFFTWAATAVGMACLLRFLLVHPFFPKQPDPSFMEKHKIGNQTSILQVLRAVANDPVLFLHPTKGQALKGCCGCVCVCCGNQWSSFGNDTTSNDIQSPGSFFKPSPQRSTWDLSDDESDNLQLEVFDASP